MGKILCVLDGMTDPGFQPSALPNLAAMHFSHLQDTCCGDSPETLNCVLHLLGVPHVPRNLRGYVEALGAGIPLEPDDLILRGSWYQVENGVCTVPGMAPRTLEDPLFHYYFLEQYKCVLVFPHLAEMLVSIRTQLPSDLDIPKTEALIPEGLAVLQEVFRQYGGEKCCLTLWGQSVPTAFAPFPEKAAVVCGKGLVCGIASLLGMDCLARPGFTGDTDTDLKAKLSAALSAAEQYPFVLLHINGADEASHRRDPEEKRAFLARVDREILEPLLASPHALTVVSDHGSDPRTGKHLGQKQPVFVKK